MSQAYQVHSEISEEGTLHLENLPFPPGEKVKITVVSESERKDRSARYPLHGTPIRYIEPTAPVAETDWDAAR